MAYVGRVQWPGGITSNATVTLTSNDFVMNHEVWNGACIRYSWAGRCNHLWLDLVQAVELTIANSRLRRGSYIREGFKLLMTLASMTS